MSTVSYYTHIYNQDLSNLDHQLEHCTTDDLYLLGEYHQPGSTCIITPRVKFYWSIVPYANYSTTPLNRTSQDTGSIFR